MQDHQRYFPVRDAQGKLMPWFVTVSNIESADPSQVIAGNERVVRPRLSDAAFFYRADRQRRLDSHVRRPAARDVPDSARLAARQDGTRARPRPRHRVRHCGDPALADRAAQLSKCDLLTNMVGEFPSCRA